MPSSLDEWWSTRFEQPRVQSYSGATPRGPPGAETFSACCSAMNDSAVQKDSGLYAGRVAESRVAVRQRNAKHVPSRLAHVDDPETKRLQEEEIKRMFFENTLRPQGTFGGSSWVPMPSSLSTYSVCAWSNSTRGGAPRADVY